MYRKTLNPPNNWDYWTDDLKQSLNDNLNNSQVGLKIVFQNDQCRVWSIHLSAGESLTFHRHSQPYVWTVLSAGKSQSYYGDGSVVVTDYEIGDTKSFPDLSEKNYFVHNLENIGKTMLIFITIEFFQ